MEPSKEEQPIFLERSSRLTRGKRMNKLLDEEIEEDESFWNQDAFKEEENDEEYEEEADAADEFDSDFDEDEPEPGIDAEDDVEDRVQKPKKKLIYPGKPPTKKKKKDLVKLESAKKEKSSEQLAAFDNLAASDDVEGERTVRKSTRTSVVVRQAERDAIRAALQATMKPVKRKREGEEKRMTQEEMLLEAAQTEIRNLRNLERVLAREEEVKKRAIVHKEEYTGRQIRFSSKNGHSFIEFSRGLSFVSEIMTKSIPYPQKSVCVVTGLPARYRDPKTGLPYATKEAFQILHKRYAAENSSGIANMYIGNLFDSVVGQGFSGRRKRTPMIPKENETSNARYSRRFHRIPTVYNELSD